MPQPRICQGCYTVRLTKICNGLGEAIEKKQRQFIDENQGKHVSKEKTVMKLLRELLK